MPQLKTAKLIENASVSVRVGNGSRGLVAALGASVLLFAATGVNEAQAQSRYVDDRNNAYIETNQQQGVVGRVLDIQQVRISQQNRGNRGRTNATTIVGAVVGGLLGHQVGGGRGKDIATAVGAATGGTIANRAANRRNAEDQLVPGYTNIRQVQNDAIVTVAVRVGGDYETYQIQQSAAIPLRRGDTVILTSTNGGREMIALPADNQSSNYTNQRNRRYGP